MTIAAVNAVHPLYSKMLSDWQKLRHCYQGERVVKEQGEIYLPATSGMYADDMTPPSGAGWLAYKAYRQRAVFHDLVKDAVEFYIGLLHNKPTNIKLPAKMEPMLNKATQLGETMQQLLRRIHEEQLVTGRLGLLADFAADPTLDEVLPYLCTYNAEAVRNWDEGAIGKISARTLNLVILDESEYERGTGTMTWQWIEKYRVLNLGQLGEDETKGEYSAAIVRATASTGGQSSAMLSEAALAAPSIRGVTLDKIPFVFVNSKDVSASPDIPPLLGLCNLTLAIYRGEADYRQNLFMQGQDTLVVIGGNDQDTYRTGAGAVIKLSAKQGAEAKYIGVESSGLEEQRQSLENDKMAANNKAGQLIDTRSRQKESGEALGTRLAAQTATLKQIAQTSASALERVLKTVATWVGANPDEVEVTPMTEFGEMSVSGQDVSSLQSAVNAGFPLSQESLHGWAVEKGLTKMTYEDEVAAIDEQKPMLGTPAGGMGLMTPPIPAGKEPVGGPPKKGAKPNVGKQKGPGGASSGSKGKAPVR